MFSPEKLFSVNDPVHAHAIQALAIEAQLPVERVGKVYAIEFERLMVDARVKEYLPVLTSRRVRRILREQPTNRPSGGA